MTASDVLVECLMDWGVEVIFGLPGDGINGVMEALRTHQEKIRFVQVRHEETAAFMACGYAKYTGKLGVCLATSGPGGIHLLNGLYDAKLDGQPVLAITGLQFHDLIGTHTQQDVALDKLFMDVCVYNERVMGPTHMQNVVDLACRKALCHRGVAHITIPVDFQDAAVHGWDRSKRNLGDHTNAVRTQSYRIPNDADLRRAADILNDGKKVAILAGRGALGAGEQVEQVAELLAAPIVKPLLGKAVVPDDSPYTTGAVGLLGTAPSQDAMEGCDTLFMIGTSFPYIEYMPKPGKAKAVQIDSDPTRIALRYPVDVGLVGDSRTVLEHLTRLLKRKEDRDFLKMAQDGMKRWWEVVEKRGTRMDKPMKPQVIAWELGKRLRDDAIVSCDSGTIATWWAREISARRGQMFSLSGTLATMAPGLPYTLAAQIAYPERQCVGFVGDGGFSMLMADFVTAVKHKLPVKIVIVKNNTLGQIKWEQMVFLGNPEYGVELAPIDFAAFARACGGTGYSVDDPKNCGEAVEQFLNTPGPAILEAMVDPLEPPLPGKVKAEQALKFAESLARGEPNRSKIALTVASDKVREMV
ncbi:MAG TPA: thiamine pyrophosphate-dependent enzyme [Candidatus Binatia bacterium]|nr:thiamine pyrophosphate-dependent enzyme [Candidatus Binatia bacterium]